MSKSAIVFTIENKPGGTFQKQSVLLAASIRACMPDVDIYCGFFTKYLPDPEVIQLLKKFRVNIVEDIQPRGVVPDMNLWLRSYCKDYFAERLLDQYDYLIYTDVDVVFLKDLEFGFDPTEPMCLVDKMPDWVKKFEATYTDVGQGNLYYGWIDIINKHNKHLFKLDWNADSVLHVKNADIAVSKNIDQSNLPIVQQTFGAYHCLHPINDRSQVLHYDSFGEDGSLISLATTHPDKYKRFSILLKDILGVQITNKEGLWEARMKEYS